ncbi:MAG TPA: hypothetical protein VKS60_26325 [Stellaceae bacterium]|nr:hypothetical protein [Stellaceae bacterium]
MTRQSGVALITVLIGVAILALIAAVVMSQTTVSAGSARGQTEALQAEAIADAAVAETVLALGDRRADHRPRVDGVPRTIDVLGTKVEVTVQDEYGRIDLNQADGGLLVRLFHAEGLSGADAAALADKVLDWREPGPGKHLNGATADDYRDAGYAYLPRRAAFQTVDELRLVMGMTPELYDSVRPALTIYSGRPGLNLATAPVEALVALPGFDRQKALDAVAGRLRDDATVNGPVIGGRIDPAIPLAGWPFTIRTKLVAGRRVFDRSTTVRLTADPNRPFWILSEEENAEIAQ